MKKTGMAFIAVVFTMIGAGCSGGPVKPDNVDNKRMVNRSFDQAWTASMQALASQGYAIQNSTKEAGTITTTKKTVKLTTDDADCGSYMGFAYLSDNRTVVNVAYSVFIRDMGNGKTEVSVDPTIDGTYQASAGQSNILTCYSKGTLEKALLSKIAQ